MIELRGTSRSYRFDCSGTNALCRLEELTGRPFQAVLQELRGTRPKADTVRAFVAAALVDPPATAENVGPILKDIGGVQVIRRAARALPRPRKVR